MADYDAIVIGGGHNGLVAALYLARAGWRVIVIERGAEVGGAMATEEVTLPGFKHDLFATNLTFFTKSPIYRDFQNEIDSAGVRFRTNKHPYASAYDGGRAARVYTEPEWTEREMAGHSAADLAGWRDLLALYRRTAQHFLPLFFTTLPSAEMLRQFGRILGCGPRDAARLAHILWQSSRAFSERHFKTPEVRGLFTPWSFHLDYGPDIRAGATFAFISAFSAYLGGFFVVEGGAGRLVAALRSLIESAGGRVLTGTEVRRVRIAGGRAVAVETAGGETISAGRAIISNVTPTILFSRLVAEHDVPAGFLRRIRKFRFGPGTFVVHLALAEKLAWRAAEDLSEFNYIHLGGTAADIDRTYREALSGLLPTRPMLIFSQTTQVDPTRAPSGRHIARLHVRAIPRQITGDGGAIIAARDWGAAKEAFADRLIDQVADHAPNLRTALLGRHEVSPLELEERNPNLVGGDCNGGSHHLDQNYFLRPIAGWSRYATPIKNLYMAGAGTWPGGGVHGGAGYLLARRLLGTDGPRMAGLPA